MKTSDFNYCLPAELIAQKPIESRDSSRLIVVDRGVNKIEHKTFRDIAEFLQAGDCLVINDTRVLPARLKGVKDKTGGKAEIFLLTELKEGRWEALVKPGRRLQPGTKVIFKDGILIGEIEGRLSGGKRIVRFEYEGNFKEILKKVGEVPLPPYVHRSLKEPERYQTIYSKEEKSVAAPTAGLHFTPVFMDELKEKGVRFATVTLEVGLDTFRPVKTENIEEHEIHKERFKLTEESADIINKTILKGKRVVAVGTTSVRVLESSAIQSQKKKYVVKAGGGVTDLFIYPGYEFKIVDALITNFHLPKSTLLMLVSAFAGHDLIMRAYKEAIDKKYRFFSFGDAMLII
ncbi:tRNA preQ1(34) S-adenosylmethionine ribosyltransferase-isomerase QueA [Candidatus Oleimmundimicrobium sp.]|uniref:tRNA preQ1(34) S-adenosylmethionine ribosyltransferase-isomerase QueA n=1 Tax=Candidatus Oleimmundimicrobium sp. TaxID=3060597 RepID=UPI0027251ED4|nr:tRNA preQ1(34) S-adenosylmethionine ribosyltransferase-isomerase QueA [Candidatus Oleimmundimicrobium sp.]MDO8886713.1 tRNA preQ1(34) S-adenosylmethionine ribosyltransferase-isomerase QueA [Candidatus Oleimmundimicrobium sp.]